MEVFFAFLSSVMANVAGCIICKWLYKKDEEE